MISVKEDDQTEADFEDFEHSDYVEWFINNFDMKHEWYRIALNKIKNFDDIGTSLWKIGQYAK